MELHSIESLKPAASQTRGTDSNHHRDSSNMTTTFTWRPSLCVAALFLASCGGGGGGGGGPTGPSITTSAAKYSQSMLVTVSASASNLDANLTVASPGCKSMTRSTAAPNVSDASTAYYTCTVSAVGAQTITATRSGETVPLASGTYSVPAPKVSLTLNVGAAVAGTIEITLAPDKAPITVDNFLRYVNDGFFNNTVFHRVSPGFFVQGGSYRTDALRNLFPPIPLESTRLRNLQWSVAMARTDDPISATSGFFINVVDNAGYDPGPAVLGYAVFGSVTAGTDLVMGISGAPCAPLTLQPSGTVITVAPFCTPQPLMVMTSVVQTQ